MPPLPRSGGGRLTSAATMSMMRVGSLRLPTQSLKKLLGGIALNLLAPNAALPAKPSAKLLLGKAAPGCVWL